MYYFYWDASALAKRYAPEVGTPLVNVVFSRVSLERMLCLSLGVSEVISVLVRKRNAGHIPSHAFSQALIDFRAEVINSTDFQLLAIDDIQLFASHPLIEQYALNATDALILRSALDVAALKRQEGHDTVLLSSDQRLVLAAQREGLPTINPEIDTPTTLDMFV